MNTTRQLRFLAWSLSLLTVWVALVAWLNQYDWQIWPLDTLQLFPLLGLWAFSLMWVHYVMGFLRDNSGLSTTSLKNFYKYTGYAVLVLICLHPALLILELYQLGYGLPPESYKYYVGSGLVWVTILGTISLLVFLTFELHRWFDKKDWWHWIVDTGDFAMLAIAYHGLRLGGTLQTTWFKWLWIFYALVLTFIIIRKYWLRYDARPEGHTKS